MSTKTLDHIVHLTPPGSLAKTVERWEKLGFKVIPGGTHADGLTENALIILSDTTYLELISFTHGSEYYPPGLPERAARDAHAWAGKSPGWIDFALLGFGSSNPVSCPSDSSGEEIDLADVINKRAAREGSGAVYVRTVPGGRTRPDGQELRWRITAPDAERHGRGVLPFFCGDVTERELRVPVGSAAFAHPNTTKAVAHLRLLVADSAFTAIARQITSVVGHPPVASSSTESSWKLETPKGNDSDARESIPAPKLILTAAQTQAEELEVAERGPRISEVAFWVEKGHEKEDKTQYGNLLWLALN